MLLFNGINLFNSLFKQHLPIFLSFHWSNYLLFQPLGSKIVIIFKNRKFNDLPYYSRHFLFVMAYIPDLANKDKCKLFVSTHKYKYS